MTMCPTCMGEGIIITCWDDMCNGIGHCIHGDGEEVCPECYGEGEVDDFDDDRDDEGIAEGYNTAPSNNGFHRDGCAGGACRTEC